MEHITEKREGKEFTTGKKYYSREHGESGILIEHGFRWAIVEFAGGFRKIATGCQCTLGIGKENISRR